MSHESNNDVREMKPVDTGNNSFTKDCRYVRDGVLLNVLKNPRCSNAIVNPCDRCLNKQSRQDLEDDSYEQILRELRNEMDNTLAFKDIKIPKWT